MTTLTIKEKQLSIDFFLSGLERSEVKRFGAKITTVLSLSCMLFSASSLRSRGPVDQSDPLTPQPKANLGVRATDLSQRLIYADDALQWSSCAAFLQGWRPKSYVHPQQYNRCLTSLDGWHILSCITPPPSQHCAQCVCLHVSSQAAQC